MIQIRKERDKFMKEGLLPSIDKYPISMTLIVALMLLIIGVISIAAMLIQLNLD
jgi:putative membrane protein